MSEHTSELLRAVLRPQWQVLLKPFGAIDLAIEQSFLAVVEAYSRPDRHFHNLEHVHQVLGTISSLEHQLRDSRPVRLAAWFHDVVYCSQKKDNEERSADRAEEVLRRLRVPGPCRERIRSLILATKTHQVEANDPDAQVLVDADLAILGASPAEYARYAAAIRQEYAWVADGEYRAGRRRVLEGFLGRPRIYRTEPLSELLEAQARHNLTAEIESLRG